MQKERLFDAFGELIYAFAMADGNVHEEEVRALESHLENYEGAKSVSWSFNYSIGKEISLNDAYKKAFNACVNIGPISDYEFLFELLDKVAEIDGVQQSEKDLIVKFKTDLRDEFMKRY